MTSGFVAQHADDHLRTVVDPLMWMGSGEGQLRTMRTEWLVDRACEHGVQALTPPDLRRGLPLSAFLFEGLRCVFDSTRLMDQFWQYLGYRLIMSPESAGFGYERRSMLSDTTPRTILPRELHIKLPYWIDVYNHLKALMPRAGAEFHLLCPGGARVSFPGPQHKE